MKAFRKSLLTLMSLFIASLIFAQGTAEVEMADTMRSSGKIYVVVAVLTIIFLGIAAYLFLLDRKIGRLESEISAKQ